MTSNEIAKTTTYNGLETFLAENDSIFQNDIAFNAERTEFATGLLQVKSLATMLSVDNTAYSAQKIQAKQEMSIQAASLAGFAQVILFKKGKHLEASQLHVSISDYMRTSDSEAKALAQSTHDLLNASIADLTPDYVTAADLNTLQTKIDTFNNTHGTSTIVHQGTPEQRKNFKAAIQNLDTIIINLRLLARKYMASNPEFYSQLIKQSTFISAHVHHTTLSVSIKSKADNSIIANATGTLNTSTKTGISDENGLMSIEQIRKGTAILTIKADGFKDYTGNVSLISGHDNHFDILI